VAVEKVQLPLKQPKLVDTKCLENPERRLWDILRKLFSIPFRE
jgi:hypothetical protein